MTEKLYYQDPYQFDFTADITDLRNENNRPAVILNRTCFYPEGGGQPADRGWLNDVRVIDVQTRGGEILHFLDRPLNAGPVHGKVDARRRLDFMQQHTGQHILSQSLLRAGNFSTLSVHFGDEYTTVEIDAASLSPEQVAQAEEIANRAVEQHLPVRIHRVAPEEASRFNIRKPPPEVREVRIVEIQDFDFSACGGTHVRNSAEVGPIKIVGQEKIRGHVRLKAKIGRRALRDYQMKNELIRELTHQLTCNDRELLDRVGELVMRQKQAERDRARLQGELMGYRAAAALEHAEPLGRYRFISAVFENSDPKSLKGFVAETQKKAGFITAAFSRQNKTVHWVIGASAEIPVNLAEMVKPLLPLIGGRGGGQPRLVQGGGNNPEGIDNFIETLKQTLRQEPTE